MKLKAYAKINLSLNVLGKRTDGYHDLDMVMLPLKLHDEIIVKTTKCETNVICEGENIPSKDNLCLKAIKLLKNKYDFKENFEIRIKKNIPIKAGLGGGSSDAAALLNYLVKTLKINITKKELIELAAKIGGDVPFFLFNKCARVRGIGEKITFINPIKYYCLLIKPEEGLYTKDVFLECDKIDTEIIDIDRVILDYESRKFDSLGNSIGNSLEKPAFRLMYKIQHLKNELQKCGAKVCLMSGSGSTIFALFESKKEMNEIALNFENEKVNIFKSEIKIK